MGKWCLSATRLAARQQIDLVFADEALVQRLAGFSIGLVVVINDLDRTPQQRAARIEIMDPHLYALQLLAARCGIVATQ
jgi:hypothetical protein